MASMADVPSCSEPNYGCLYVVQLERGRIKVGISAEPLTRLAYHRGIAEAHGCQPGPEWVSQRGADTADNENRLITSCVARATARFRSEYFTGVPFLVAVREGARICDDREAKRILRRPGAAAALTALAETRKRSTETVPFLREAAEQRAREARLANPWIGRAATCTEAEAASWLGVPVEQIHLWVRAGKILRVPTRGPGQRLRLRTGDVQQMARVMAA